MRALLVLAFLVVALALTVAPLSAQSITINKVSPEAAALGEEITVTGTNMSATNGARFTANTGGFVGVISFPVPPGNITIVDNNTIKLRVPTSFGFVKPPGMPAGDPLGSFEIRDTGGLFSNSLNIFYLDGAYNVPMGTGWGDIDTGFRGEGSTNSINCRAAASFTFAGGGPFNGNAAWVFTGDNMTPGSTAILLLGTPFPAPVPLLDGQFPMDFTLPILNLGSFIADPNGQVLVPAALPAAMTNFEFTLLWVYTDAGSGLPQFSNGLTIII